MSPNWAAVGSLGALAGSVVTAAVSHLGIRQARKGGRETNAIGREANDIEKLRVLVEAQGERIDALESEVADLRKLLTEERREHQRTHRLLQVALRHIREVVEWGVTDRSTPLPPPPDDLLHAL